MAGSDLFSGTLDLLILKALAWKPMHGYAINRWIRESSGEALLIHEGVLYPALHRLERRGLLEEEWGITERNREAKFYRLTESGRAELQRAQQAWRRHAEAVDATLRAATSGEGAS